MNVTFAFQLLFETIDIVDNQLSYTVNNAILLS